MKSYLSALKEVSSWDPGKRGLPESSEWQQVLMRGLLGLLWGCAGALVAWLASGDRLVSVFLGTIATVVVKRMTSNRSERLAIVELSDLFLSREKDARVRASYSNIITLLVVFLRPVCIFILLLRGSWLWMAGAAALSYAVGLDCEKSGEVVSSELGNRHWLVAGGIAVLLGAIVSKVCPDQHSIFLLSIICSVLCWLLPMVFGRFGVSFSKVTAIYIGETLALVLGFIGKTL